MARKIDGTSAYICQKKKIKKKIVGHSNVVISNLSEYEMCSAVNKDFMKIVKWLIFMCPYGHVPT